MTVLDEMVKFKVFESLKFPEAADDCYSVECSSIEVVNSAVQNELTEEISEELLDWICDALEDDEEIQQGKVSEEESNIEEVSAEIEDEINKLLIPSVLQEHKATIGWTIADIKGISPTTCMHHILLEEGMKPSREAQRRLNPNLKEVVNEEVIKLLKVGIIYPISGSKWVSPVYVMPKKSGITVVANENNELIPTRKTTGWRVCIDYRKLNTVTKKDHFPLPFIDQMLERLV
ncbi:hypothetical protein Q3G72_004756 [Acer saccharum]|nr:hypothetical protein Q3G72_004756 [Acer saccharum]